MKYRAPKKVLNGINSATISASADRDQATDPLSPPTWMYTVSSGSVTSITINLEGTIDGSTWFVLATKSTAAGMTAAECVPIDATHPPCKQYRINCSAIVPNGKTVSAWLYLPWVVKPLWSPFVDLLRTKRSWIVSMQLEYAGQVSVGEQLSASVTVREKHAATGYVEFDCDARVGDRRVLWGRAVVEAPRRRRAYSDIATPEIILRRNDVFARLLLDCEQHIATRLTMDFLWKT